MKKIAFLSAFFLPILSVYSASIYFIAVFIFLLNREKYKLSGLIKFISLFTLIYLSLFLKKSSIWNVLEIGQTVVFLFLFSQADKLTKNSRFYLRPISLGLLLGSLIISGVNIWRWYSGDLVQRELSNFLISGTFNYTSIYLFLGLLVSPLNLGLKCLVRISSACLFFLVVTLFQSRGVLMVGLIFIILVYLAPVLKSNLVAKYVGALFAAIVTIFVYYRIQINTDTNHILFSIIDFSNNTSNVERLSMILDSYYSLDIAPFGWGIGNSSIALNFYGYLVPHAHSTIPQWLFELGYLGAFLSFLSVLMIYNAGTGSILERRPFFLQKGLILAMFVWILIEALQYNIMLSIMALIQYMFIRAERTENAALL
jgi:hypothetical protein